MKAFKEVFLCDSVLFLCFCLCLLSVICSFSRIMLVFINVCQMLLSADALFGSLEMLFFTKSSTIDIHLLSLVFLPKVFVNISQSVPLLP